MKRLLALLTLIAIIASCSSPYERSESGYEYRVIRSGKGSNALYGNSVQFHLKQFYKDQEKDTVYGDTRDYISRVERIDSGVFPKVFISAFLEARAGDSIVIRMPTDSAKRYSTTPLPWNATRDGYLYISLKVLNIFTTEDQADSARHAEIKLNGRRLYDKQIADFEKELQKDSAQTTLDSKKIKDWLDQKQIPYTRGKWGTFIHVTKEGEGETIAYNDVVAVNYTERIFDSSRVLESSTDPQFGQPEPYEVSMRQLRLVLAGWVDALLQLKQGSKATIYLPSTLAFGKRGKSGKIPPNSILVFDIEVMKVISEDEAMRIAVENRHRREQMDKQMNDQSKKKNPFF